MPRISRKAGAPSPIVSQVRRFDRLTLDGLWWDTATTDADKVAAQFTPGNAYSQWVHGHDVGWTWWVPLAWQAVADPSGPHPVPPLPVVIGGDEAVARTLGHGGSLVVWWGPFLHLTMFGLGWNRPDLGIERWLDQGRPTDDPILSVVDRWWAQKDGFRRLPRVGESLRHLRAARGIRHS